jgi:hypothetical protein
MAGILEGIKDELDYKPFFGKSEDEIGCNGSHKSI